METIVPYNFESDSRFEAFNLYKLDNAFVRQVNDKYFRDFIITDVWSFDISECEKATQLQGLILEYCPADNTTDRNRIYIGAIYDI